MRASVANLPNRHGNKREAQILLATFPVLTQRAEEDDAAFKMAKHEVLAQCWSIVLEALTRLATEGLVLPVPGTDRVVKVHVAMGAFKGDNLELVESLFTRLGYSPRCSHRDAYQGGQKWFKIMDRTRGAALRK